MTECIHGLELAMCDVCTPRAQPAGAGSAGSARRARAAASAGPGRSGTGRPEPARPMPGVAVRRAGGRRYLVVDLDDLGEELGAAEASDWSGLVPAGVGRERVVAVAAGEELDVAFVAVANEPARRRAREALTANGIDARVMVQPDWFG
ncbi:MAG: hypothetical protein BGO95_00560 [Micrococcales bacterium 73-13]|nr:MAG: hypothetical protein BGO95_00560 [Micrococcales bacterium 73-13]